MRLFLLCVFFAFCIVSSARPNKDRVVNRAKKLLERFNRHEHGKKDTKSEHAATNTIMQQVMAGINALPEGSELRNRRQAAYDNLAAAAAQDPEGFEAKAQKIVERPGSLTDDEIEQEMRKHVMSEQGKQQIKDKFIEITNRR
jgi:hypothetical protein